MAPALSPGDIPAVRMARYRQSEAGGMLFAKGTDAGRRGKAPGATVDDPPEEVAEREMRRLGLPLMPPADSGAGSPAGFDRIRDEGERHADILVFQEPMDADSVRSVVLAPASEERAGDWKPPPTPHAIIVDARDAEATRTFSPLHAIGGSSSGGCTCKEGGFHLRGRPDAEGDHTDMERTEEWRCDIFATAAPMPHDPFLREIGRAEGDMVLAQYDMKWDGPAGTRTVASLLSKRFVTPAYAAAVRALGMPQTMKKSRYRRLAAETANTRCRGGGRPARIKKGKDVGAHCLLRLGRRLLGIVLSAHDRGEAAVCGVMDMLDMRLDDVDDALGAAWDS